MDLGRQIVAAAQQALEEDRAKRACNVTISFCHRDSDGRYDFQLRVAPDGNHVIIRYKTLEYRVARSDKAGYEGVIRSIREAIINEATEAAAADGLKVVYDVWVCIGRHGLSNRLRIEHEGSVVIADNKLGSSASAVRAIYDQHVAPLLHLQ